MVTIRSGFYSRPWSIVPLCALLHFTYTIGYLIDPDIAKITAMNTASTLFGSDVWVMMLIAASIAILPMFVLFPSWGIHLCLWPQQFMMFLMALSVLKASFHGIYPDGTIKGGLFIFVDQCWAIYLTLAHFRAVIRNAIYF